MKTLSKRDLTCFAFKSSPDVIHRISPETGKLMEHIGDNTYRDVDTQKIYKAIGTVSNQTKQDTMLSTGPGMGQILYPRSA